MSARRCSLRNCEKRHFGLGYCQMHHRRFKLYGDPLKTQRNRLQGTPEERFWKSFKKGAGCWVWAKGVFPNGYGKHPIRGRDVLAHRFAFELLRGPVPDGLFLDHRCNNRACVNPDHLRPANNKQNMENQPKVRTDNRTGHRGVSYMPKRGKFRARVHHNGKEHSAGLHETAEIAAEAAKQLRLSLFTHNDADQPPSTTS